MSNLPIHPKLEKLNLPALPWNNHLKYNEIDMLLNTGREVYAADKKEVCFVCEVTEQKKRMVTNLLAAAPDLLNVLLHARAYFQGDEEIVEDIDAIIARAMSTTPQCAKEMEAARSGGCHFVRNGERVQCWIGDPAYPDSEFVFEVHQYWIPDIAAGLSAMINP